MLALRRLRIHSRVPRGALSLSRGNASLQSVDAGVPSAGVDVAPLLSASSKGAAKSASALAEAVSIPTATQSEVGEPEATEGETQGRRRRKKAFTKPQRPAISATEPRKWNRPLKEGVLPAYDLALKVLRTDSIRLKAEAAELRTEVEAQENTIKRLSQSDEAVLAEEKITEMEEDLEGMRKKLHILEVQSEINLPEVRWRVANAMGDMSKPVHRHLMEQKWRKEGGLDLLMERIHQMKVVPDVLPVLHPSIDLHITAKNLPKDFHQTKRAHVAVEPGVFLTPAQTLEPPKLYANVFHTDKRLYTLLLVDPDMPNEEQESFSTFLHWMVPNIPLSATHQTRIPNLNSHTPYIPPHPQRGTPYHRYVLLLLPHPPVSGSSYSLNAAAKAGPDTTTSQHLDIPVVSEEQRRNFDVRAFARQWGLNGALGGGAHMWREVWSEEVSTVYTDILKEEEPRFGRPPKADPYAELKQTKRYV